MTARFTTADLAGAYGLGVLIGVIGVGLLIAAWLEIKRRLDERIDDATRLPQHPRPVEPPTEPINNQLRHTRSTIERHL